MSHQSWVGSYSTGITEGRRVRKLRRGWEQFDDKRFSLKGFLCSVCKFLGADDPVDGGRQDDSAEHLFLMKLQAWPCST